MNKQPEQTMKTKQKIISAFWDIALINGTDKVTISAITKKAKLNRSTFYAYFADMPDLIAQAEDEIIADLKERITLSITEGGLSDFSIVSNRVIETFALYDDKFFMLIGNHGDPDFRAVIQKEATKLFSEIFKALCPDEKSEYIIAYLTSGLMGLLTYWHETGKKITALELAELLHTMATKGVVSFIG